MHYLAMKFKGLALLGLISALLLSSASPSFADRTASPSPSASATSDFQSLMDQYKENLDQYRIIQISGINSQVLPVQIKTINDFYRFLQDSRDELRLQINRTFMDSVDKANKEARSALKSAKSASAKNDVISKQKIAVTAASVTRDTAILALGALPSPPAKPLKQGEAQTLNKTKSKKASPTPTSESEH